MINAGTVAAFLTLDTEKFDKGIKGANAQLLALGDDNMKMRDKLKGVGSALTDIGRTMTTHVTLPLAGAGLAALNVAANFDEGMSKVAAISGATGEEFDDLRAKARQGARDGCENQILRDGSRRRYELHGNGGLEDRGNAGRHRGHHEPCRRVR